jgi:hypothetical protein
VTIQVAKCSHILLLLLLEPGSIVHTIAYNIYDASSRVFLRALFSPRLAPALTVNAMHGFALALCSFGASRSWKLETARKFGKLLPKDLAFEIEA